MISLEIMTSMVLHPTLWPAPIHVRTLQRETEEMFNGPAVRCLECRSALCRQADVADQARSTFREGRPQCGPPPKLWCWDIARQRGRALCSLPR